MEKELILSKNGIEITKKMERLVGAFILQNWGSDFETILNSRNEMVVYVKDNSNRPPVGSFQVRPNGEVRKFP